MYHTNSKAVMGPWLWSCSTESHESQEYTLILQPNLMPMDYVKIMCENLHRIYPTTSYVRKKTVPPRNRRNNSN